MYHFISFSFPHHFLSAILNELNEYRCIAAPLMWVEHAESSRLPRFEM